MEYSDILERSMPDPYLVKSLRTMATPDDRVDRELDDLLSSLDIDEPDEKHHKASTGALRLQSAPVASRATSEPTYSFPHGSDIEDSGIGDPVKRLSDLVNSWKNDGDYMQIREEYCRLSIAMNHEGLKSPAFRPTPTIPFLKKDRKETDKILHKDKVIIDCHWLRCRHEEIFPRDDKYRPLFDATLPFSFDLATSFACENWTNKHRADEALILTEWQQSQLLSMQSEAVQNRRRAAEDGIGRGADRVPPKIVLVRKTIREWCRKDKRIIPHREIYEDLWLAHELLGTGASMNEIAELGGMISGVQPSSERVVRDKLQRLDKRMLAA